MTTVAHISDMHFGRLSHPGIVEALHADIQASDPSLVVISGDLTQRARKSQFKAAARMITSFSVPVMVVPGNHDVPAWYRPISRVFNPLDRYESYITPELQPTFERDQLAVAGLNTAHGLTVKGGKVRVKQVAFARSFFQSASRIAFRILVLHHPLVRLSMPKRHDVARSAQLAMELLGEQRIDLVLCGHVHRSLVESVPVKGGHSVVFASAGTATSSRGREDNRKTNIYNVIRIERGHFAVEERHYVPERERFEMLRLSPFSRT